MAGKLPVKRKYEGKVTSLKKLFSGGLEFIWLGQSGFIFSTGRSYILTDAYLSNYLESNHGDLPYAHDRMIPPPVEDSILSKIDYILISHGHEDHLDPDLVRKLSAVNPGAVYLAPPGCKPALLEYGAAANKIKSINYSRENVIHEGFSINAFPSAHPKPLFDPEKVWALSYQIKIDGKSLLFAGDTTVYPELTGWLVSKDFDLLILPVNGRDPKMEKNGIIGNMNFEEGLIMANILDVPMLGTHFGMFAFNTVDPHELRTKVGNFKLEDKVDLTELSMIYSMK